MSKFNEDEDKKLDRQIRATTSDLTIKIREAEENIKVITHESTKNNIEEQLKTNMKLHSIEKLKLITKDIRINEQAYMKKYQEYVGEDTSSSTNYKNNSDLFLSNQNKNVLMKEPDINMKKRGEEIDSIVKSIDELSSIFKDLQTLVIHQGSILDRIDYNIDESLHNVKKGYKELQQANENLKSNCARNGIFILIIVIFVEAVLLLLK
jgi:syntaxin 16